jgi:alpha-L-fucosidase
MKRRNMIKTAAGLAAPLLIHPAFGVINPAGPFRQEKLRRFGDNRDWFFEKRYGLFIHWGLYSIPAWHEQHQWRAKVPRAEYVKLSEKWNPVRFNPDRWLDIMEEAGMKYITVTTKHHDGFCLWDTKQTPFNTMNTPYRKDIIGMLADACHRRKVPLSLYYSIADWNHPAYPNQGRHHELAGPEQGDTPDWNRYMEFLKEQVKELCTSYGEIHGFWWDMNVPLHKDPSINAMIRKLQPSAVINNRGFDDGDFGTPERDFDSAAAESGTLERPTEACQSVGMESWGYREDEDYYSTLHLERSIDRYLARDANYLLNVGPDAEGLFPATSLAILRELGKWYKSVMESYDAVPAPRLVASRDVMVTCRENVVYLHFNKGLTGNGFKLKPFDTLPEKATILNTGKPAEYSVGLLPSEHASGRKYLRLKNIPVNEMSDSVIVVKLQFKNSVNLQENA